MIDNLVSNHLLPAYKQNRAHSRHYRSEYVRGYLHRQAMGTAFLTVINNPLWFYPLSFFRYFIAIFIELLPILAITKASDTA